MPGLAINNLSISVASQRLLHVPQLTLRPGALVGVSGPSGAGKTTFLHALGGLITGSGTLRWGETDLMALGSGARTRFRRLNIGMIFQDFLLFEELTAQDNACAAASFAPRKERAVIRSRAETMMSRLGIAALARRRVESLSGGERQRVATARALATDPAIILADEPTASLDRQTADRLIDDLVALAREGRRTVIAVSHDERVLARMDRIVTLRDGVMLDGGSSGHE